MHAFAQTAKIDEHNQLDKLSLLKYKYGRR